MDIDKPIDLTDLGDLLTRGQEDDAGHLEYKYRLTNLTPSQKDRLISQMKYRLHSDREFGEAVYDIGLTDDGFALGLSENEMKESLVNLREIVVAAGARICDVRREIVTHYAESEEDLVSKFTESYLHFQKSTKNKPITTTTSSGSIVPGDLTIADAKRDASKAPNSPTSQKFTRHVAEVLIRKNDEGSEYIELRIGVAGNVDCGKSTLVGVLTKGVLDDGRGAARLSVFNFKHEAEVGRTSSVAQQIMGFNDKGQTVNDTIAVRKPTWEDIVKHSTKVVTFFDLAGHERYLRTTISGITSNKLDYALIMVGSNMGITQMTVEHVNLCLTLGVPFIIVMTKIDLAPPAIKKRTFDQVTELVKKKARKLVYNINGIDDVMQCSKKIAGGDIAPIFHVSNVSGEGLSLLKTFMNYLPVRKSYRKAKTKPIKMQVQNIYNITGTGTVVAGMLISGRVKVGDNLLLGPTATGEFMDARVRTIECKRVSVSEVTAGKFVCLGVPNVSKGKAKKGMFILDSKLKPTAVWEFIATIYINTVESSNVKVGYQPHCHIGHIKQTCKILEFLEVNIGKRTKRKLEKQTISLVTGDCNESSLPGSIGAGDIAKVRMRFCFRPELIMDDKTKFVFRERKTRGIGMINEVTDKIHTPLDNKSVTRGFKQRPSRRKRQEE